ncbi:MAG: S9 family peptidase [Flavobacteriales bacterium]|nr:S9 family peptidase [Flavobacteriales bacterium]
MKRTLFLCAVFGLAAGCATSPENTSSDMAAPIAKKIEKELTIHGDTRIDPYYWLNQREDPEVIAYLEAENAYTAELMKGTEGLQETLYDEIVARIPKTDESVPYFLNGYWYYTRFVEGGEYPIYCRKEESLDAEEEIILNVNEMAEGHDYYQVVGLSISPDNKILSYGVDTVSRRIYTVHFKNLETGEDLENAIPNTTGRAVWAADNKHTFYSVKDESLRSYKIFRHQLGTSADADVEIFHENDPTFNTFVYTTKSKEYIVIGSASTVSNEYRILSADDPTGEFRVLQPRERDLEFSMAHYGNYFYILTNWNAKNFRLMRTRVDQGAKDTWEEVIPHREETLLEGIEIFNDFLVVEERTAGLNQIQVRPWEGEPHYIQFDSETYTAGIGNNPEFDSQTLRFGYGSMTTPSSVIDYDMATRVREVKKEQEVLGDFDKNNYAEERIWATADDGTKIPMSVVYRKGMEKNGANPTMIYGYGSYGATIDPGFSYSRLSLLDRGFVFAIAHIRGGQYMGRDWYENGKMLTKKNTFTDFVSCSKHLIDEGYTSPEHLYAMGGSAGGLLMGAVINLSPETYNGVIAAVPFVDVVTTMLDESIPLTTGEYDEWGNPNEKEYYDYILSYSPYDQVEAEDYPNMLVTTGLHDSQVQYWEPAKWVAKLRDLKTDDNRLLLHTNMEAGHSGASGRFQRFKETALEYAFILDLENIQE